ncbi:lipopolysaccharide biosynthesis protein [Nocardioides sp. Soil774]|uniref:lipopolysaccharide biosynthesis protein n=1 Tax=Nocardioides sp. Soil774 TaxID=1736408 RepID=UPI00138F32D6|nr:oligosaccharide flippase family protein [Nocardioides sp. Soil774]
MRNTSARGIAIVGLTLATVVVARVGGPDDVGAYALLRMLPGLVGVMAVAGLPGAMAFFLAEPRRHRTALWPSVFVVLAAGAALGTLAWVLISPLLKHALFPHDSLLVVAAAGLTVATQLVLTVGKTSLQGLQDRRGGDIVIAAEEIAFLPCYLLPLLLGVQGTTAIIVGLLLADVVVAVEAWRRVAHRLGWRRLRAARSARRRAGPDRQLVGQLVVYGLRGQVGGIITLLNLRVDFVILGAVAGPAVLGIYAVASKYAELLRMPGTALTWVCYPRLAATDEETAARIARRLVAPTLATIGLAAVPLWLVAGPVTRLLYGTEFDSAVAPARVLLAGMLLAGTAGVASGYLYGRGRPGLNSVAMAFGLVTTVGLDLVLIPRFQAMGAAVASTASYLLVDAILVLLLLRLTSRRARRDVHADDAPRAAVGASP